MHLQAVHGWPNASCNACQRIRSSLSLVSHTPQPSGGAAGTGATAAAPATGLDAPKLSLIPTASMGYVTAMDNFPPLTMKQSTGARANPANVEAEAEHLRQMEGQDYRRMEGIIRRRLHRDSENLDISLEVRFFFFFFFFLFNWYSNFRLIVNEMNWILTGIDRTCAMPPSRTTL